MEPPEGISSVVSARRVRIEGMVMEFVDDELSACDTVIELSSDNSET